MEGMVFVTVGLMAAILLSYKIIDPSNVRHTPAKGTLYSITLSWLLSGALWSVSAPKLRLQSEDTSFVEI